MSNTELLTKEEIIKQFELPERKSKINSILKMSDNAPLYCVCQSTDISRFMICCEKCDEWYHGDCIGVDDEDAQHIKKWFCPDCVNKDGLKVVYRERGENHIRKSAKKSKKSKRNRKDSAKSSQSCCNHCSNCLQNEECGNKNHLSADKIWSSKRARYKNSVQESEGGWNMSNQASTYNPTQDSVQILSQCYGPQCTKPTRVGSKYCSDECGLALAQLRILKILPGKVYENMSNPSIADIVDREKLNEIIMQKTRVNSRLKQLEHKEKRVQTLILRAKRVPLMDSPEETIDVENKIGCVLCGWDIPVNTEVKHMEMCFKKYESKLVVESKYKSSPDCNILCEYYNEDKKTYCKRLRYICPDHFKPQKSQENEVCGCPLTKVVSKGILHGAEKYCQQLKLKCDLHYNWEILALADIDMERFQQWNKLYELAEKEAAILKQMSSRCGVLGLLLHSTYSHQSPA